MPLSHFIMSLENLEIGLVNQLGIETEQTEADSNIGSKLGFNPYTAE